MQNDAIEPSSNVGDYPVAKQVFKPKSWLTKIDYINRLVLFNNVIIAVLAEHGAGKTTFAELLQSSVDLQIKAHLKRALPSFSLADFLAQLNSIFPEDTEKERNLAQLIDQINKQKIHVLIIIDDAQNLSDSFLQEILVELKQQGEKGFFHLCLVANYSLVSSLNKLEPNFIHTLEPGVLNEAEAKTYLLSAMPFSEKFEKSITEAQLDQFYQFTGGNIARINNHMNEYFALNRAQSSDRRKSIVRNMSFLAGGALALMASSYIWQNQFLPSSASLQAEMESEVVEPILAEVSQPLPSLVPTIPVVEKEPVLVSLLPDINHELASQPSRIPGWLASSVKQQVQPSPKRIVDVSLEEENDDSLVVRDRVVVIPKNLHPTELSATSEPATAATSAPPPTALPAHTTEIPKPLPIIKLKPKISTASRPILKIKQTQPGTKQFTIQLLASRKRDEIMRFINSHKMNENVKIRLTKRDGLDWYVLTIGEFGQRDQAHAAIKNLPAELAQFKPWIRPVEQLKAIG